MTKRKVESKSRERPLETAIFGIPIPFVEPTGFGEALVPIGKKLVAKNNGQYLEILLGGQCVFRSSSFRRGTTLAQSCRYAENHLLELRDVLNESIPKWAKTT